VSAEPELRLAFGNAAADYERGRPGWPDEVAGVGGLSPTAEVLDLGAGTGKLTRVLARRFERVVAVEPDASMLAVLRQVTDCYLAVEGSAEEIPLTDASVDGVFCAEAFHWFDWPAALAEIERVLRPQGSVVLCFSTADGGQYIPLSEAGWEIARGYRRPGLEPGGTIVESGAWQEPFEAPDSAFEPLRTESFPYVHVHDADAVVARVLSTSVFAALPPEERQRLAEELRPVVPDGVYETRLRAEVWWTRLR
jgi:SAM-dependent methyltransferase